MAVAKRDRLRLLGDHDWGIRVFRRSNSYGQILAELSSLSSVIHLTLPASLPSVRRQFQRIVIAQNQLYQLETEVEQHLLKRDRSSFHQRWHLLLQIIQHTIRYADNLRHLAEEFPVDPEGSAACLRHLNRRQDVWIQTLHQLRTPTPPNSQPISNRLALPL